MRKKFELEFIIGIILFFFGLISVLYNVSALIINIFFAQLRAIFYIKDVLFDLVFILIGTIIIRKRNKRIIVSLNQR